MIGFVPGSMVELHLKARRQKQQSNLRYSRKIRQRIENLRALLHLDKNVEVEKIISKTTLAIQLFLRETDAVLLSYSQVATR